MKIVTRIFVLALLSVVVQVSCAQMGIHANPGDEFTIHFAPVEPYWSTTGGDILSVTERSLTYKAPAEPGVYLIIWQRETDRNVIIVRVRDNGEDVPCEPVMSDPVKGTYVPTSGRFIVWLLEAPRGVTVCLGGGPIAGRPPSSCQAPKQKEKSKVYRNTYTSVIGSVTVTSEMSAELLKIGVKVAVGTRLDIIEVVERTTKITLIDCYECVDGRPTYKGSRVEYVYCDQIHYTSPAWACEASKVLRIRHCGMHIASGCVSEANCPCPQGPVFIGCP